MKKILLLKYLLFTLPLAIAISACDNMKEDVSPDHSNLLAVADDAFTTYQNQGINLDVLPNDTYGAPAKISFGKPKHGTLSIGQSGQAFYQPDLNYIGKDSLTYTACIGSNCAAATIRITVLDPAGCTIKAVADQFTVTNTVPAYLNVLQNDSTCGALLEIHQQPVHGKVKVENGQIKYLPDTINLYTGPDPFYYKLSSSLTTNTNNAIAKVDLTIVANCILNAVDDQVATKQNRKVNIQPLLNDTDCGGTLTIIQGPLKGFIPPPPYRNVLEYTPLPGVTGIDSIRYAIAKNGISSTATITINILSNSSLVCNTSATNDYRTTLQGNNQSIIIPILNNDQVCGSQVTITRHPTPAQGYAAINPNDELVFVPNPNFSGMATMDYALSGPNGYATATVHINMLPNNSNPCYVDAMDDVVTFQNTSQPIDSVMVPILNNDKLCPNGGAITISSVRQSNYGQVQYRSLGINSYVVYYIYSGLQYYTDSCQYQVCQGGNCDTATVIVNIQ